MIPLTPPLFFHFTLPLTREYLVEVKKSYPGWIREGEVFHMVDHHLQGLQPIPEKVQGHHKLFKMPALSSFLNKQDSDTTNSIKNVYIARLLFTNGRKYTKMLVVLCIFYFLKSVLRIRIRDPVLY